MYNSGGAAGGAPSLGALARCQRGRLCFGCAFGLQSSLIERRGVTAVFLYPLSSRIAGLVLFTTVTDLLRGARRCHARGMGGSGALGRMPMPPAGLTTCCQPAGPTRWLGLVPPCRCNGRRSAPPRDNSTTCLASPAGVMARTCWQGARSSLSTAEPHPTQPNAQCLLFRSAAAWLPGWAMARAGGLCCTN